jgi:hypothetical protein
VLSPCSAGDDATRFLRIQLRTPRSEHYLPYLIMNHGAIAGQEPWSPDASTVTAASQRDMFWKIWNHNGWGAVRESRQNVDGRESLARPRGAFQKDVPCRVQEPIRTVCEQVES